MNGKKSCISLFNKCLFRFCYEQDITQGSGEVQDKGTHSVKLLLFLSCNQRMEEDRMKLDMRGSERKRNTNNLYYKGDRL